MAEPILVAKHGDVECHLLPDLANRHGLITGATGTGKTITLQTLAENFSRIGVPARAAAATKASRNRWPARPCAPWARPWAAKSSAACSAACSAGARAGAEAELLSVFRVLPHRAGADFAAAGLDRRLGAANKAARAREGR